MRQLGYAGKTPHRGDFVRHNVPRLLRAAWDDWLSALLHDAETRLHGWQRSYDEAPVWRFALSPDIAGEDARAGVLLPSRDGVGRRYPFTVFATLDVTTTPIDAIADELLLEPLERLAREALADSGRYGTLKASLESLQLASPTASTGATDDAPFHPGSGSHGEEPAVFAEDAALLDGRRGTARLLDAVLRQSTGPYSVWRSAAATGVDGRLIVTGGLPHGDAGLALLGADWPSSAGGRLDGGGRTDTRRPDAIGTGPHDLPPATATATATATAAIAAATESATTRRSPSDEARANGPPEGDAERRADRAPCAPAPDGEPLERSGASVAPPDPLRADEPGTGPDATPTVRSTRGAAESAPDAPPDGPGPGGTDEPFVAEPLEIGDEDEEDPWDSL